MFPPMTPLGEKVRVELENQQIERDAALRAQQPSLWHSLQQCLASLAALLPKSQPRKRQPEFSFSDVNASLVDEC